MNWRFQPLTDVFISCCETNLSNPEITDNFMTLATGFLKFEGLLPSNPSYVNL